MGMETLKGKRSNAAAAAIIAAIVALVLTIPIPAYATSLEAANVKTTQTVVTSTIKSTCAKVKAIKKSSFSTATRAIEKRAIAVKKGSRTLNFKGGQGYLKFTAPMTKSYSFKFSNMRSLNHVYSAFVEVQMQNPNYPTSSTLVNVNTAGGSNSALWLAPKDNRASFSNYKKVSRPLKTRTGTLSLTAGESVYLYFFSSTNNTKVDLKIS